MPLSASDAAAWASAIAAITSLGVAFLVWKLTRDGNRWQRFEKRAEVHWRTREYLRAAHNAGFQIRAPMTQEWWREIWLHRFLFNEEVSKFLSDIFDSGAKLEQLATLPSDALEDDEDAPADKEERKKEKLFHSRRLASSYTDVDKVFAPYLQFKD